MRGTDLCWVSANGRWTGTLVSDPLDLIWPRHQYDQTQLLSLRVGVCFQAYDPFPHRVHRHCAERCRCDRHRFLRGLLRPPRTHVHRGAWRIMFAEYFILFNMPFAYCSYFYDCWHHHPPTTISEGGIYTPLFSSPHCITGALPHRARSFAARARDDGRHGVWRRHHHLRLGRIFVPMPNHILYYHVLAHLHDHFGESGRRVGGLWLYLFRLVKLAGLNQFFYDELHCLSFTPTFLYSIQLQYL